MVTLCQLRSPCVYKVKFDLHFIRKRLKSNEYNIKKRIIKVRILDIKKTANPYL